MEFPMKTNIH